MKPVRAAEVDESWRMYEGVYESAGWGPAHVMMLSDGLAGMTAKPVARENCGQSRADHCGARVRRWAVTSAVATAVVAPTVLDALYVAVDIETVPIARLISNLEARAAADPSDLETRLNLARTHAMAYALRTDTTEATKATPATDPLRDAESPAPWFGYEPNYVPWTGREPANRISPQAARSHLLEAIALFRNIVPRLAVRTYDNMGLTARLGFAWCLDQAGQRDEAIAEYRRVIDLASPNMTDRGRRWPLMAAEAAGYLLLLLDARRDREEIASLTRLRSEAVGMRRAITPIVIPLQDGSRPADMVDLTARVKFDADGSGLRKTWTWISTEAAWLVWRPQSTPPLNSALQLFGDVTFWLFWENGYHALRALDDDGSGELTGRELLGLAIWHDVNGNGVSESAEVAPLHDWGIVALSCEYVVDGSHLGVAMAPRGVSFLDGSQRPTYDVLLWPVEES